VSHSQMPAMEAEEGNTCGMLPYLEVHKKMFQTMTQRITDA